MYGKRKTVEARAVAKTEVRAVYNSEKVKVMVRRSLQSERVKIVLTLKKRFFRDNFGDGGGDGNGVDFEEQFQKLLKLLKRLSQSEYV